MADTKLILRIDNLAHKLISAESEIAFGETFDIIFEGLENYSGKTAGVYLDDISGTQNLWGIDAAIQTVDGKACIQNCVINTEEALEVLTFDEVETRLSFYLKSVGYSTYYGEANLRLHPGKNDDGETYTELVSSIEQHDADPNSHLDIRTELGNVRRETISSVNTILADHKSTEEAERNQAIANAISESEAKLTNAFDTSFAATESRINAMSDEIEGHLQNAEEFRDDAKHYRDNTKTYRDEAKSAEGSVKSIQRAVTDTASAVAKQAEACAAAQEVVVSKTVEVEELHSAVTNLVGDIDRIEDIVENLDEIVETETPKIEAAASTAQAAAATAQQMVDSINYSFDTWSDASVVDGNFIGPAQKDGQYPRLHNRNKDIHGVTGFSGDTYHNARFLLDWDVAMSNDRSYLLAGVKFESNRGMGGETPFYQPLIPDGRIPNFEYSPLYWIGHILYNDAQDPSQAAVKQVTIPWSKIAAGGSDAIALASDLEKIGGGGGSVYESIEATVGEDGKGTVTLDPTVRYYKHTITQAITLAITAPAEVADGEVLEFRLLLEVGATKYEVAFPESVTFPKDTPQYLTDSQILLSFVSVDKGETWKAVVDYEYQTQLNSECYIQTNLIHHFDAIDNVIDEDGNRSHDASSDKWYDLVGTRHLDATNVTFGEDAVNFNGKLASETAGAFTIAFVEIVFKTEGSGCLVATNTTTGRRVWVSKNYLDSGDDVVGMSWYYNNNYGREITLGKRQSISVSPPATNSVDITAYTNGYLNEDKVLLTTPDAVLSGISGIVLGDNRTATPFVGEICAVRFYSTPLTAEQVAYNYEIDKKRFGL